MIAPGPPIDVLVVGARRRLEADALAALGSTQHRETLVAALPVLAKSGARLLVVGFEEIRGRERTALAEARRLHDGTRILVLAPSKNVDAASIGADDCLVEPYYPDAIRNRVRALLGRPTDPAGTSAEDDPEWAEERDRSIHDMVRAQTEIDILREVAVAHLARLSGARRVSLMESRDEDLVLRAAVGLPDDVGAGTEVSDWRKSIALRVVARGRPIAVPNVAASKLADLARPERYDSSSFMVFPVVSNARVLGVLNFADPTGEPFGEADLARMQPVVDAFASALFVAFRIADLIDLSIRDALTGLYNRRYFDERLPQEVGRAKRYGHSVSLLLVDLDDFKTYNDTQGHPAGDRALKQFAALLLAVFRETDVVCRLGGDEFAVVMPETDGDASANARTRFKRRLREVSFAGDECLPIGRFLASIGRATSVNGATSAPDLTDVADDDLYRDKAANKKAVSEGRDPDAPDQDATEPDGDDRPSS